MRNIPLTVPVRMDIRSENHSIYDINYNIDSVDFSTLCLCFYSYMKNGPYKYEMAELLLKASAFLDNSILHKHNQIQECRKTRQTEIFEKFIFMIKQDCSVERNVRFYADKLHITPQYLSKIIKNESNRTASEWIDEFVVLEAKALFKHTNLTIQEISNKLNFANQSSFGKFFKKKTGINPKEYMHSFIR